VEIEGDEINAFSFDKLTTAFTIGRQWESEDGG
jgi:hypothetical protein